MKLKFKTVAGYVFKMLTMPAGTSFEWYGRKVGRFAFTWNTTKAILSLCKGR